jgi:hypothetical protein
MHPRACTLWHRSLWHSSHSGRALCRCDCNCAAGSPIAAAEAHRTRRGGPPCRGDSSREHWQSERARNTRAIAEPPSTTMCVAN